MRPDPRGKGTLQGFSNGVGELPIRRFPPFPHPGFFPGRLCDGGNSRPVLDTVILPGAVVGYAYPPLVPVEANAPAPGVARGFDDVRGGQLEASKGELAQGAIRAPSVAAGLFHVAPVRAPV